MAEPKTLLPPSVPDTALEYSVEEKAIAKEEATKHIQDPQVNLAFSVLLASRQLYSLARVEMQKRLLELKASEATEDLLVQAVVSRAELPFQDQDLLHRISTHGLVFLQKVITKNIAEEKKELQLEKQEEEAKRRNDAVPIGFDYFIDDNRANAVARTEALVLVGDQKPVQRLLEIAMAKVMSRPETENTPKIVVAQMLQEMHNNTDATASGNRDKTYVKIGINHSVGSANSHNKLDKLLALWRRQTYKHRIDLLIVENMGALVSDEFASLTDVDRSVRALNSIDKWSKAAGCATIGAVICQPSDWDEYKSTFTSLGRKAHVRFIEVKDTEDNALVELVVGDIRAKVQVARELIE